jgi:NADP-dependent 3-hydroxy acid dehydrogenase YdfG
MNGPVAIVTGAGGALGRATSRTLADSGFTVVAVDRNEQALRELPDGIRSEVADTTDPAVARPLVHRIAGEVGPPEVLVNTIGAFEQGDALAATPATLGRMMDVNLGAALWVSQAVAPHMQQRGSGAIVHVTARPAIEPTAGMGRSSRARRTAEDRSRTWSLA